MKLTWIAISVMFLVNRVQCGISEIVGFKNIGVYYMSKDDQGNSNKKIYFVSTAFRANWMNAQSFCKSYGMDLAAIESEHEANYFLKSCEINSMDFEEHSQIGGVLMNNDWFWITSHQKVNFKLDMKKNDKHDGDCLQLVKSSGVRFSFGRTNCFSNRDAQKFVCQKLVYKQTDFWSDFLKR